MQAYVLSEQPGGTPGETMVRRRIIRRKARSSPTIEQRVAAPLPMTRESFGLKPDEDCEILVIGGPAYCSFTLARLGRLGITDQIGITNSESHAVWAVKNLAPKVIIASVDYGHRSGGIDLMRKLEAMNPDIAVIVTSSTLDISIDGRALRDLAWAMSDSWSFVTRRKTDNGDPLGIAVVTARQGVGWIDYPVRKQLEQWRVNVNSTTRRQVSVAV